MKETATGEKTVSPQYRAHPGQGVGGREARLGEEQPGRDGSVILVNKA